MSSKSEAAPEKEIERGCLGLTPYLKPNAGRELEKYEYHALDEGILYAWFWSPFADWIALNLPRTLA